MWEHLLIGEKQVVFVLPEFKICYDLHSYTC